MNAKSRVVFVVRAGPRRGRADLEAAFPSRQDAVRFAVDLHGLEPAEAKTLAKSGELELDRVRHGSVLCALREERMSPDRAKKALSGELYLLVSEPLLVTRGGRAVRRVERVPGAEQTPHPCPSEGRGVPGVTRGRGRAA